MLISERKKFIFIHVPKNAGTSITRALAKYCMVTGLGYLYRVVPRGWRVLQKIDQIEKMIFDKVSSFQFHGHITLEELSKQLTPKRSIDNYFKFAVVRNPLDHEVSNYKYILKQPSHFSHQDVKSLSGFDEYLIWKKNTQGFITQSSYLKLNGEIALNFWLKYENLQNDFDVLKEKLNLNANLGWTNKTKKSDLNISRSSIKIIEEEFKEDYLNFGYPFPI